MVRDPPPQLLLVLPLADPHVGAHRLAHDVVEGDAPVGVLGEAQRTKPGLSLRGVGVGQHGFEQPARRRAGESGHREHVAVHAAVELRAHEVPDQPAHKLRAPLEPALIPAAATARGVRGERERERRPLAPVVQLG